MVNMLKENDLQLLQKYRLSPEIANAFNVANLMEDSFLSDFMKELADSIGAPSEKIAASIFIKRYAFIAVISLYAMTEGNKKFNLSLNNIEMEAVNQGKDWLPLLTFKDLTTEDWNGEDRDEWRKTVYQDLFAKNINLIIEKLEKTFHISKMVLWENIAVYLFWLYETELKDSKSEHVSHDFHYLIFEAEGALFGNYKGNPLQQYFGEKTYMEEFDEAIRKRKTCCFSYQLASSSKRCKTCPCRHITNEERCQNGENICSAVRGFA